MKKPKLRNNLLRFSGVAFQMGATIGLGAWGGSALDSHYQTNKIFTLILTILGVGISLYLVIKEVIQMSKENDEK